MGTIAQLIAIYSNWVALMLVLAMAWINSKKLKQLAQRQEQLEQQILKLGTKSQDN